ncbi:hypothetical protein GCM10022239_12870 [Leifsonia bigeumensis]|uniref:Uncharacterized protein n=1 Tax=Leifsonella bigeumensis TaxID=433643 RepID=A0ABP7FGA8_9MICO
MRQDPADRATRQRLALRRLARPWTIILVITGLFQLFRGAPVDGAFFLAVAAVLLADEFGLVALPAVGLPSGRAGRSALAGVAAVLGTLMVLAPRHGLVEGLIVSGIGLTVLLFAWPDPRSTDAAPTPLRRAGILWAIIAVAICLIEVTSFLLGLPSEAAQFAHPSISLLLDPALDTIEGRVVFTALWLVVGIALLRRGTRR